MSKLKPRTKNRKRTNQRLSRVTLGTINHNSATKHQMYKGGGNPKTNGVVLKMKFFLRPINNTNRTGLSSLRP